MKRNRPEAAAPCVKKTTIGGQALLEGLMMVGPESAAMAVRLPDGSIRVETLPKAALPKAADIPFVRGSVRLFKQLVTGVRALLRSAEFAEGEGSPTDTETPGDPGTQSDRAGTPADGIGTSQDVDTAEQPQASASDTAEGAQAPAGPAGSAATKRPERKESRLDAFLGRHSDAMMIVAAALGILMSVVLFILLPNFLASFIEQFTPLSRENGFGNVVALNLFEGLIRIIVFVAYLALASRMKDIRRVWMYHGAEHKTIACYESGQPLTVENIRPFSTRHPRCGTAFLFLVLMVSILVFSFVGWYGRLANLAIRLALVPLVAGIAYEIVRWTGRRDGLLSRIVAWPGLRLQALTTREPDDAMLEVAIAATLPVIPLQADADRW